MPQHPFLYPESPRQATVDQLHGQAVPDAYRWLEELDTPATRTWIAQENELTFAHLNQIPARDKLRQRFTELWRYEKFSVPSKRGGRYFFTRNDGLQNQSILYWMDALDAEPQVLLDPNQLSADGTVALTDYSISEDGRLLAYGLSASGSDWQEWHVREVDGGLDLADHLQWIKWSSAAWTHDNQGFFYSRYAEPEAGLAYKEANYYHKLYYHQLGTSQAEDQLIYERLDQKEWGFGGQVSEDGRYLIIHVSHGTHPENGIFYQDLQSGNAQVIELINTFDARYQFIGNDHSLFYFLTDFDAPLSRVIALDIANPARADWQPIIAETTDTLESVSLVDHKFMAAYLHNAQSLVQILDKQGNLLRTVELPDIGSVWGFDGDQADQETFYGFTSFTQPTTIYRYDVRTGQSSIFRSPQLGFNPADYVTEQVFYPSKDGTRVPMFISRKRGLQPDKNTPVYLYGYGGFNISLTPAFGVDHLVWMEMGGLYAQPNLRGGGEFGKAWHDAGTKLQKQNVFDDFIAAAEWLIENQYTSSSKLAIGGHSNGGLLVGACLTQRPALFGACLVGVGVLDMLRFDKFTIGWAWTSDYGSPEQPDEFNALLAYSPYHNVKPGTVYPPTLITVADHDDRVFPAHSFKFAAALQTAQAGAAPVLIRIETKAGHGAGKPTAKIIEEKSDCLAFFVQALEISV
ncbi:prolyl oligopeptidase family serine peptidase [soil metagenome]